MCDNLVEKKRRAKKKEKVASDEARTRDLPLNSMHIVHIVNMRRSQTNQLCYAGKSILVCKKSHIFVANEETI